MFLTRTYLDRRTFLRGMGATVALPLLEAMVPAGTALAATAAGPVPRLAFVYFPHGAIMDAWTPPGGELLTGLGPILGPLEPFASHLTVVSGLENRHAHGPVHALTPGTWLLGSSPRNGHGPGDGTTADQIAARHLGGHTLLSSIQMSAEAPRAIAAGAWAGDIDEAYGRTISFRAAVPVDMEVSPRRLFNRMFAASAKVETATGRIAGGTSVLDCVAADAAALPPRLGARDRATLADYLETIRDVEYRVERAEADSRACAEPGEEAERRFGERQALMFDLAALAFRADITRVVTFMLAAETSAMTYRHLGMREGFHLLSHHQHDPAKLEALVRIQRHHTSVFAGFVRALAGAADGDGSLLDQSLILYGSNMADSHAHDHYPLPVAVVGGGCGAVAGGRHVRFSGPTPISNLLLSLLQRAGVPITSFADSTEACAGL